MILTFINPILSLSFMNNTLTFYQIIFMIKANFFKHQFIVLFLFFLVAVYVVSGLNKLLVIY